MSFLEAFTDEEKNLIVALPYRAGLWVSLADEKGEGTARAYELKAIKSTIKQMSKGMFASAFVHEVIQETYKRQSEWGGWALQTGTVPDDARHAVVVIKKHMMPQDAEAYIQMIMTMAYETAYAFREFDRSASIPIRIWVGLKLMWERFIRTGNSDYRVESLYNISLAEDEAIAALAVALSLGPGGDNSRLS